MFHGDKSPPCKVAGEAIDAAETSAEYLSKQTAWGKTLFPEMAKYVGMPVTTIHDAKSIHSAIECDVAAGYNNPMPADLFTETAAIKDYYMYAVEGFSQE
ncbi:MAG: hypothetical protein V2I33_22135 [Kangiellaceae bacterium]|jgi:hypothetical protein|nr:hypothetical protein [Kangiellaceae bacterium]